MMKLSSLRFCRHRASLSTSASQVRVRFAPSPTGFLHLGGLRTALINFLFARKHNGKFILRIEDTDQTRIVPGAVLALLNELKWANLTPDEGPFIGGPRGPYIQSQRLNLYRKESLRLLEAGHIYRCFCSSLRLDLLRKEAIKNREIPKYDNRCRQLSIREIDAKLIANEPYTLRLVIQKGEFKFDDLIHGEMTLDVEEGDPILLKSDGYPTYHLANVVDDHLMDISHVLRGNEWQLSTPKHIMLYRALGWEPPSFGHLPLIIDANGEKLSKRNDDIRVENLRKKGTYPQVLISYINSMNSYSHPSKASWSLDEIIEGFDLRCIGSSASRLSLKLMHELNRNYILHLLEKDESAAIETLRGLLRENIGSDAEFSDKYITNVLKWSTSETRVQCLPQLVCEYSFLWKAPEYSWSTKQLTSSLGPLENILGWSAQISRNSEETSIMTRLKDYCQRDNINYAKYMKLLRLSLTNNHIGPPVGEILQLVGRERFSQYLENAAGYVKEKGV